MSLSAARARPKAESQGSARYQVAQQREGLTGAHEGSLHGKGEGMQERDRMRENECRHKHALSENRMYEMWVEEETWSVVSWALGRENRKVAAWERNQP